MAKISCDRGITAKVKTIKKFLGKIMRLWHQMDM